MLARLNRWRIDTLRQRVRQQRACWQHEAAIAERDAAISANQPARVFAREAVRCKSERMDPVQRRLLDKAMVEDIAAWERTL